MSFCRFETVKTDNSDTYRFYISREGFIGFQFSPFRFTKERLNTSIDTSKKNNHIKTHPANPMTCRVRIDMFCNALIT